MLRLQHAGLTAIKVEWKNWTPDEDASKAKPTELEDLLIGLKDFFFRF